MNKNLIYLLVTPLLAFILFYLQVFSRYNSQLGIWDAKTGSYCQDLDGGLFNPCYNFVGYSLEKIPQLSQQGTLSFAVIHNNTGPAVDYTIYNVAFACTTGDMKNNIIPPLNPTNAWMYANASGVLSTEMPGVNSFSLYPGDLVEFSGLVCYNSTGKPLGNVTKGTIYNGYIWLKFTSNPGLPGEINTTYNLSNSYIISTIALISVNST